VLESSTTIYALAFLEGGNCWANFVEFDPFSLKRSAGVGVRLFLPMFGMIGVDWGYGFDTVKNTPSYSGGHFAFTIGQEF
jgi:outer membrane protein insertion porin family